MLLIKAVAERRFGAEREGKVNKRERESQKSNPLVQARKLIPRRACQRALDAETSHSYVQRTS